MKIEKLNDNKIKITFNIDDLEDKNIDLYSFMHNSQETQDLFWDLLNKAERECGFNVDNSMIYVEATTTGGGNFTLIVTKTNEKPTFLNSQSSKKKNIKLKRKTAPLQNTENIYEFECFDDICEFIKVINISDITNNSLYSMNGKYYLKTSSMSYNNILEYANICASSKMLEAKLNEYGKKLIDNYALQSISKIFYKKSRK